MLGIYFARCKTFIGHNHTKKKFGNDFTMANYDKIESFPFLPDLEHSRSRILREYAIIQ